MKITVNGKPRVVSGRFLPDLLDELGYAGAIVATAVNHEFVPARVRAERALQEGDRLEVVAPMQGG
jgi:sulfur carrier protein